jgi:aminopeptidase-like protein
MPHHVHRKLDGGEYRVELETEYAPGEMLVAHSEVKGRSDKIVVFNAHTCHPHMANDGFAGVALLIRLMQWLQRRENHYTYRLVLGPEHLGTVFYLRDRPRSEVDRMVCGMFAEMPGTCGPIKVASTFRGGHRIDRAFANVLGHYSKAYELVAWRKGAGNDETVWEAPSYEVPFVEVTRCEDQFAPFREYHSSLDVPDLMDAAQIEEMFTMMKKVIEILEDEAIVQRRFDGLICRATGPGSGQRARRRRGEVGPSARLPVPLYGWQHDCARHRGKARSAVRSPLPLSAPVRGQGADFT